MKIACQYAISGWLSFLDGDFDGSLGYEIDSFCVRFIVAVGILAPAEAELLVVYVVDEGDDLRDSSSGEVGVGD